MSTETISSHLNKDQLARAERIRTLSMLLEAKWIPYKHLFVRYYPNGVPDLKNIYWRYWDIRGNELPRHPIRGWPDVEHTTID